MTKHEIVACLAVLESSCKTTFSEADVKVWRELLGHLAPESVMAACKRFALDGDGFPTVSKINKLASESQNGDTSTVPDVWPAVLKCVRRFGVYQRDEARSVIPPLVWKALGGDVGWEWLCDMTAEQRLTASAQFRGRYQELRESERKRRGLPEHLRPRINNDVEPRGRVTAPETRKLIEHTANGMKAK